MDTTTEQPAKTGLILPERMNPAQRQVATVGETTNLLQALVQAARDPSTDITKMERLFAMHKEMQAISAEQAYNDAMARAQAHILPVARDAENTQTNSRYATLAAICKAIVPVYSAEGLSVSFNAGDSGKPDLYRTLAIVSHAGGHKREFYYDLPLDDVGSKGSVNKTKVHATKSTTSYAKNALLCMIFNVATKDDDGNTAGAKNGPAITADHLDTLDTLLTQAAKDKAKLAANLASHFKVKRLADLPDSFYAEAVRILNEKIKAKAAHEASGATQ